MPTLIAPRYFYVYFQAMDPRAPYQRGSQVICAHDGELNLYAVHQTLLLLHKGVCTIQFLMEITETQAKQYNRFVNEQVEPGKPGGHLRVVK